MNLWEDLAYSIADEIMPTLPARNIGKKSESFALILSSGETLSPADVKEISARTGLSPIFFASSGGSRLDISRLYSRRLGAPLVNPRSRLEFTSRLGGCNFSVSEELVGALYSFLSRTPSYVNAGCDGCRRLTAEAVKYKIPSEFFIPYTKNRIHGIRKRDISELDFDETVKKFRAELGAKFYGIFD